MSPRLPLLLTHALPGIFSELSFAIDSGGVLISTTSQEGCVCVWVLLCVESFGL